MSGFAAWAGAVCMAAAGCTILHLLVGNKGVGKVFRMLTAAFFLCAVLSPLLKAKEQLSLPETALGEEIDTTALEKVALEQLKAGTESILLKTVNTALESHGLEAEKVEISMDISADGSISISNISVFVAPANDLRCTWVKQIAEQRLGMEVEVRYAE